MAAMKSFHATKCCHLVCEDEASAGAYVLDTCWKSVSAVLIYGSCIIGVTRRLRCCSAAVR